MLIFIHGYNSAGNSDKAKRLRSAFDDVATPTLAYEPDVAIAQLEQLIADGRARGVPVALAGSSLGGFYAASLAARHQLPSILINPLVEHQLLRHEIGLQQNYYTDESYQWTADHCDQLAAMAVQPEAIGIRPLLLLDQGDELLDSAFAATHFANHAEVHTFAGGSHRFEHMDEAVPLMAAYMETHRRTR